MNQSVSSEMLILARESRGLTQSALAQASSVSQGNISKYESGILHVSQDHLVKITEVLEYPVEFFYLSERKYGFGSSCTYHRKRQTMPVQELKILLARINILRIQVARLLQGAEIESANSFQRLDVADFDGNVEKIATLVRRSWHLPFGPVTNLVQTIESAGGIVFRCSFGTRKLDAISQWVHGLPPIFFINDEMPGDRLRFTLAHELGHIIMHQEPTVDDEDREREADRFAAEFLMPASDIKPDLVGITLPKLARLKSYWKVSMAALVKRAFDLGKLSERQYRTMFEQLSRQGYRITEPISIPPEEPLLLKQIVDIHRSVHGYSDAELSQLLVMKEAEIRRLYDLDNRKLRLVNQVR